MEKVISNEKKYLLCKELTDGLTAERLAYLVRIRRRLDRNGNPYLTFYLKTADKVVLVGHKFRVEETTESGASILSFNRMMVRVMFDTQIYNGAFSLLIKEIVLLPQEDSSAFFDSFNEVEEKFTRLNTVAEQCGGKTLDPIMKTVSLLNVCHGTMGAYTELIDMVYSVISSRKNEHTSKIAKCLFEVVGQYFRYLQWTEKIEFLPKKEIMELLNNVVIEDENDLTSVVVDSLSALMMLGVPEHLYAKIIVDAFETSMRRLRMEEAIKASPKNLIMDTEDGRLIYY